MIWAAVGTKILATLLAAFGIGLITPIGWPLIGLVWAYAIAWMLIADWAKLAVYQDLSHTSRHHQRFLTRLQKGLSLSGGSGSG
jgi:H+-transporting ATPase